MAFLHFTLSLLSCSLVITRVLSVPPLSFAISQRAHLARGMSNTLLDTSKLELILPQALNLTALPPLRFEFRSDIFTVIMFRRSKSIKTPGVSLHNWDTAVKAARSNLRVEAQAAHLTLYDPIPSKKFHFVTFLDKPAPSRHKTPPRKLIFDVEAREIVPRLLYSEVDVVLLGLLEYGLQWRREGSDVSWEQVRMCRFELHMDDGNDVLVADGTVGLLVPPEELGLPVRLY